MRDMIILRRACIAVRNVSPEIVDLSETDCENVERKQVAFMLPNAHICRTTISSPTLFSHVLHPPPNHYFVITINNTNIIINTTIIVKLQFSLAFLLNRSNRPLALLNCA